VIGTTHMRHMCEVSDHTAPYNLWAWFLYDPEPTIKFSVTMVPWHINNILWASSVYFKVLLVGCLSNLAFLSNMWLKHGCHKSIMFQIKTSLHKRKNNIHFLLIHRRQSESRGIFFTLSHIIPPFSPRLLRFCITNNCTSPEEIMLHFLCTIV
jgi:hypothetical protein